MPYLIKSTRDEVFTVGIIYSKMLVSIIIVQYGALLFIYLDDTLVMYTVHST